MGWRKIWRRGGGGGERKKMRAKLTSYFAYGGEGRKYVGA